MERGWLHLNINIEFFLHRAVRALRLQHHQPHGWSGHALRVCKNKTKQTLILAIWKSGFNLGIRCHSCSICFCVTDCTATEGLRYTENVSLSLLQCVKGRGNWYIDRPIGPTFNNNRPPTLAAHLCISLSYAREPLFRNPLTNIIRHYTPRQNWRLGLECALS